MQDPGQEFARTRLLELSRDKPQGLVELTAWLQEAAAEPARRFAATLLLGHLALAEQRFADAEQAFQRARALRPGRIEPLLALASSYEARGGLAAARQSLLQARELASTTQKAALSQRLAELAMRARDFDAARAHFADAARGVRGGSYAQTAYARALLDAGEAALSVEAFRSAEASLAGDRRALPPLLLQLARAQRAAQQPGAAVETLERARTLARGQPGLAAELLEALTVAHREAGSLGEFAEQLWQQAGRDAIRLARVGRLREELGDPDGAVEAYRRALRVQPRDEDTHLRLLRLLRQLGDAEQVTQALQALVAAVPGQSAHAAALAEQWMITGHRDRALSTLKVAGVRFARQAAFHEAAYDLYERWGETRLAEAALRALVRAEPAEPAHLIALGEHQRRHGDTQAADRTFLRILHVGPDRAAAHAMLGGLYLEQDRALDATRQFERAVALQPDVLGYVRGLAEALERTHRGPEAIAQWRRVLSLAASEPAVRREARRHIVAVWHGRGELDGKLRALRRLFESSDAGDADAEAERIEAGRMLAEGHLLLSRRQHRGRPGVGPRHAREAEAVLQALVQRVPDDLEALLALERLRAGRGDAAGAIEALDKLAAADPGSARDYLARMARHALAVYRDEDALVYARRAVEMAPGDASAHRRLADLYRGQQNVPAAIRHYRRALELDPRAFQVCFDLAELHLAAGGPQAAAALMQRVVLQASDDELVARAARTAIQLAVAHGGLGTLEQAWLPLALAQLNRPIHRRMLVELYDASARPLIHRAAGRGEQADRASEQLAALGARAIKPLLEALSDDDPDQRRIAIDILGHVQNPHAAAPLLTAAEQPGDVDVRRRALLAAGSVATPALAARFEALAQGPQRRLRTAAAWGLARMGDARVASALSRLLKSSTPGVRGHAVLGLALAGAPSAATEAARLLEADRSPFVRGAAALSLGLLHHPGASARLAVTARVRVGEEGRAATAALGLVGDAEAGEALAALLFSPDPGQRDAALLALRPSARAPAEGSIRLPPPGPRPSLAPVMAALVTDDGVLSAQGVVLEGPLRTAVLAAAVQALSGPRESIEAAVSGLEHWADPAVVTALADPIAGVAVHPDPALRARALRLLAGADAAAVSGLLARGLADEDARVVEAALDALSSDASDAPPRGLWPALVQLARQSPAWPVRRAAVELLVRAVDSEPALREVLRGVLARDRYAYVREAALAAFARVADDDGLALLGATVTGDPDPGVRRAAARALRSVDSAAAGRLARDPSLPESLRGELSPAN